MNLQQLVRMQIIAEAPVFRSAEALNAYVDETLCCMTHVELLERISDQLSALIPIHQEN